MNVAKEWMMLVVATVAICAGATQPNQCPATSPDGICTNIPYADRAGCELDLYIPQGVSNFPVVVWPHSDIGTGNQAFQCAQVCWRHVSASRRMADESYAPSSMRSLCTYLSAGRSIYAEAGDTIFWCIDYPNSKRSRCANMMV